MFTVCPMKYTHASVCVFCWVVTLFYSAIQLRVASLALGQSCDCLCVNEVNLRDMTYIHLCVIYSMKRAHVCSGFCFGELTIAFTSAVSMTMEQPYEDGKNRGVPHQSKIQSRWRHNIETFSVLLALCERNSPVTSGVLYQRISNMERSCSFDVSPNKLSKHSNGRWSGMPCRSCDVSVTISCGPGL